MRKKYFGLSYIPLIVSVCIGLLLLPSCGDEEVTEKSKALATNNDSEDPIEIKGSHPEPEPVPNVFNLRSSLGSSDHQILITLIGLPECVKGEGVVTIKHADKVIHVPSSLEGSFVAFIEGKGGDKLEIQYNESAPVKFRVPKKNMDYDSNFLLSAIPGISPIIRISDTKVLVRGKTAWLGPHEVIGLNPINGSVAYTKSGEDDCFSIELSADPGDTIKMYEDYNKLLDPWILIAP